MTPPHTRRLRVCLAGNPNSGKTTLFNALTGARQRVSNYAGVTVEKREGHYLDEGRRYELLDLPGTYSLSSYSPEERIAQHELLEGHPDIVVGVVDSTVLSRSLVLVAQLMELETPLVLCLNMSDEADRAGQRLDVALLERLLGFPVVQTVGHRRAGVDALKVAVARAAEQSRGRRRLVLGERLDHALSTLNDALTKCGVDPAGRWVATRLLVGDPVFVEQVHAAGELGTLAIEQANSQRQRIETETGRDVALYVTECYYGFVHGLLKEVLEAPPRSDARAVSDAVDTVLAHRWLGLPFFLVVMYGVFWVAFTVGEVPMGWIESGFGLLGAWVNSWWSPGTESALRSLLVDGIIGGVGGVIVFLPNIVLLFLCLSLLEDTGYLSRAAFLIDHLMHRFGLHGKSFIPLVTGFGCSIPGIMATRTLENERDRLATMLVLPLMSCGARLPIWMLLIPAFFAPAWRAPMLWAIYMVGIVLALVLVLLLRKTVLPGEEAPFVMELPPYRVPTVRAVLTRMTERSWIYLRKAGTIILAISLVMWVLTAYPKPVVHQASTSVVAAAGTGAERAEHQRAAEALSQSFAGRIGRAIEPVIAPLGFDWKIGTAMLGAFAAKEVFVAQMGIVYALGQADENSTRLRAALRRDYSPLVGFSLMLFLLIAAPCMATIAITRRESGSWRWAVLQLVGLTAIAYLVSMTFYQGGLLVTRGGVDGEAIIVAAILCVACLTLIRRAAAHTTRMVPPSGSCGASCAGCGGCGSTDVNTSAAGVRSSMTPTTEE